MISKLGAAIYCTQGETSTPSRCEHSELLLPRAARSQFPGIREYLIVIESYADRRFLDVPHF